MIPSLPGEGRVPYIPPPPREPRYGGKIVVAREEGIVEQTSYGQFIRMLCEETTGDERFSVGERIHNPGTVTEPRKSDSEAVHILEGEGTLRVWLDWVAGRPMEVPLHPGLEVVITENTRHQWLNTGTEPMVAVVTISHEPFPAYPHHYPAIFEPGKGNQIHQHDNRVEAFYVVSGPGSMLIADPNNETTRELVVPPRGVGYKPSHVYHRQFNHEPDGDEACYWIHSMVVFTHRGSRMPQLHVRQHGIDGKTPIWESGAHL